jgi:hypothetical protein
MGMGVALEDENGQWIAMAGAHDGSSHSHLDSFTKVFENTGNNGGCSWIGSNSNSFQIGGGMQTYKLERGGDKVTAGVGADVNSFASSRVNGAIKRIALIPARNYEGMYSLTCRVAPLCILTALVLCAEDSNFGDATVHAIRTCVY